MTKQELAHIARLMYDLHEYCYFVNGCCDECAVRPCGLQFIQDEFLILPYEWVIDIERLERESNDS